jgi:hypothetical protein
MTEPASVTLRSETRTRAEVWSKIAVTFSFSSSIGGRSGTSGPAVQAVAHTDIPIPSNAAAILEARPIRLDEALRAER